MLCTRFIEAGCQLNPELADIVSLAGQLVPEVPLSLPSCAWYFYIGSRDPNPYSYDCKANILPTELALALELGFVSFNFGHQGSNYVGRLASNA